jgi:hypothetical protein
MPATVICWIHLTAYHDPGDLRWNYRGLARPAGAFGPSRTLDPATLGGSDLFLFQRAKPGKIDGNLAQSGAGNGCRRKNPGLLVANLREDYHGRRVDDGER